MREAFPEPVTQNSQMRSLPSIVPGAIHLMRTFYENFAAGSTKSGALLSEWNNETSQYWNLNAGTPSPTFLLDTSGIAK